MITKLRSYYFESSDNATKTVERGGEKRFAQCILHIGTEKTGTSSIQRFLTLNRAALAGDGVVYPVATGEGGGSQWEFVACAHNEVWKTDVGKRLGIDSEQDQKRFRQKFRDELSAEFNTAKQGSRLVISSEHLHSRLVNKQMIERLKAFLEPWVEEFKVVLYLRRQDRVALSLFSTKVKSGSSNPIAFPGSPKNGVTYYFDYERGYDNWCAVFGEAHVFPRLFSPNEWEQNDLIIDFCMAWGLEYKGKRMPVIENESLDRQGIHFICEVNRQLSDGKGTNNNREREALVRLASELCRGKNSAANREEARAFYQQFIEGNERLRQRAFPDRTGLLFDEDFSEYPEEIDETGPRYEDAVALAIRLWRAKLG